MRFVPHTKQQFRRLSLHGVSVELNRFCRSWIIRTQPFVLLRWCYVVVENIGTLCSENKKYVWAYFLVKSWIAAHFFFLIQTRRDPAIAWVALLSIIIIYLMWITLNSKNFCYLMWLLLSSRSSEIFEGTKICQKKNQNLHVTIPNNQYSSA